MIRRAVALVILSVLAWFLFQMAREGITPNEVTTPFMIGFVLLSAFITGTLCERFGLPRITGYIVAGIVFGPFVLDFLTRDVQQDLGIFVNMAFAFIGLAAGAELKVAVLRERARSVIFLVVATTVVVILGVTAAALAAHPLLSLTAGKPFPLVLGICGIIGVVAVARSPSSTIAIINETRSEGPFTETILGVAMSTDLIILPLFSVAVALTGLAATAGSAFDARFILVLTGEILAFVAVGALLGALLSLYIRLEGPQIALVLVGLCFLVYKGSLEIEVYLEETYDYKIHIEPLIICAAAGFTVQNLSRQGKRLLRAMGRVDLPVYVVFFTMAGAALNMGALVAGLAIAVGLVLVRTATMLGGSWLACRLAADPPAFRRHAWMGFITQAGLSVALATQLGEIKAFEGWGSELGSLLVGAIALNQIVGPVAFKYALTKVGETRLARMARRRADLEESPA